MKIASIAVLVLVAAACNGTDDSASSCVGILVVEGSAFLLDEENDNALDPESLGSTIGTVDDYWPCETTGSIDPESRTYAIGVSPGSKVRVVDNIAPNHVLAAVDDDVVRIFRSEKEDLIVTVLSAGVQSINIDAARGGAATLATINDQSAINTLLASLDEAPRAKAAASDDEATTYYLEFVAPTGLTTVIPLDVTGRRLGPVEISDDWVDAISSAVGT